MSCIQTVEALLPNMISGFTRQETISITGVNSGRLSYLDQIGLVAPQKIGNPKHPTVIYSLERIVDLTVISRLKARLSLQEIQEVIEALRQQSYDESLLDCKLIFIGANLCLTRDWKFFGEMTLKAARENKGRVVIRDVGEIGEIASELKANAERFQVLDFEKRIRGFPLLSASSS